MLMMQSRSVNQRPGQTYDSCLSGVLIGKRNCSSAAHVRECSLMLSGRTGCVEPGCPQCNWSLSSGLSVRQYQCPFVGAVHISRTPGDIGNERYPAYLGVVADDLEMAHCERSVRVDRDNPGTRPMPVSVISGEKPRRLQARIFQE